MHHRLSDEDLLRELSERVDEKNRALFDLRATTRRLEEVNRRLLESEALKGDFLSNVRNEINNPLASILALASEIGAGAVASSSECQALAAAIRAEAFALDFQLRNIFCAAEIEAGDAELTPVAVDVRALVETTVAPFVPLAAAKRLELRVCWEQTPEAGSPFVTDPAKLQVILANLLSNAVKFGGENAEICVRLRRDAELLRLEVEDCGIGIEPGDREAIFERFRQLDSGRAKSYHGHGLGLSIVKALLELMGGTISVESAAGAGSRFAALIPEAAAAEGRDVFADAGNEFFFDA